MARPYRIVSADSHLEISCARWTPRVPAKYRDRAPRLIRLATGGDAWQIENRPLWICGFDLCGKPYEKRMPLGVRYEGEPGAGSPEQRIQEQDQDGVDGEVLFPGLGGPNFWRGIRDDGAYKAVVHAYNEFLGEEYCAIAPDRLIAMGVIPETGIDDAIAEMEACARLGLKGVALNQFPSGKTFPTREDDRFWAAARDIGIPLTVHVSFGGPGPGARTLFQYQRDSGELGAGADFVGRLAKYAFRGGINATQLVMAGVFDRFPQMRLYFAENQIGWIPNFLEQLDDNYERHRFWAHRILGMEPLARRPSEYIREHCWWGFMRNPTGVRVRHEIGVDRIMWGGDFPHSEGDWPRSNQVIEENFAGVPDEERYRMVVGNVVEYFRL